MIHIDVVMSIQGPTFENLKTAPPIAYPFLDRQVSVIMSKLKDEFLVVFRKLLSRFGFIFVSPCLNTGLVTQVLACALEIILGPTSVTLHKYYNLECGNYAISYQRPGSYAIKQLLYMHSIARLTPKARLPA